MPMMATPLKEGEMGLPLPSLEADAPFCSHARLSSSIDGMARVCMSVYFCRLWFKLNCCC